MTVSFQVAQSPTVATPEESTVTVPQQLRQKEEGLSHTETAKILEDAPVGSDVVLTVVVTAVVVTVVATDVQKNARLSQNLVPHSPRPSKD